jgi:hypothetical protein
MRTYTSFNGDSQALRFCQFRSGVHCGKRGWGNVFYLLKKEEMSKWMYQDSSHGHRGFISWVGGLAFLGLVMATFLMFEGFDVASPE